MHQHNVHSYSVRPSRKPDSPRNVPIFRKSCRNACWVKSSASAGFLIMRRHTLYTRLQCALYRCSKPAASPSLARTMASASVKFDCVCFAISLLLITIANSRPSEAFLLLSALAQVSFPAVPATKPAVKEVIAVHTWNLEADVSEVYSRDDGLLALAGGDR